MFNYYLFDKTFKIISRSRISNRSYIWYKIYVLYIEYLTKQKKVSFINSNTNIYIFDKILFRNAKSIDPYISYSTERKLKWQVWRNLSKSVKLNFFHILNIYIIYMLVIFHITKMKVKQFNSYKKNIVLSCVYHLYLINVNNKFITFFVVYNYVLFF